MMAAEVLAAGLDTPALCELAGLPRNADTRDIRDLFEQALSEAGIELPDRGLARRHALRRLAVTLVNGDIKPADLAADDWWETEAETAEERSFVSLIPPCACCAEYTLGLDQRTWEADLRIAALALASSQLARPGPTPSPARWRRCRPNSARTATRGPRGTRSPLPAGRAPRWRRCSTRLSKVRSAPPTTRCCPRSSTAPRAR